MPERILFVNLPADGSYPLGPVTLASHVRSRAPRSVQSILDLSLLPASQRHQTLKREIHDFRPSAVAFSWRDVHDFAPEDRDPRFAVLLRTSLPSGLVRGTKTLAAASRIVRDHQNRVRANCEMIRETQAVSPGLRVVLGGTAATLFGEWLERRLPRDLLILPGEGETAIEMLARGEPVGCASMGTPAREEGGTPASRPQPPRTKMADLALPEPSHVAGVLPGYRAYLDRPLPVQTKRGSPQKCLLGVCTALEGRGTSYREAAQVAEEVRRYRDEWGAASFRFVDSHFLGGESCAAHGASVLEAILRSGGGIRWTGRLRVDRMDPDLASLAVRTGLWDFDLTMPTGSAGLAARLAAGSEPSATLGGLKNLARAGFRGRIHLPLTLNVPGETADTLRETIAFASECEAVIGEASLIPVVRFLWLQPGMPIERELAGEGYLPAGHDDPLRLDLPSFAARLYNPGHLGRRIAQALVEAWNQGFREEAGRAVLAQLEGGSGDAAKTESEGHED